MAHVNNRIIIIRIKKDKLVANAHVAGEKLDCESERSRIIEIELDFNIGTLCTCILRVSLRQEGFEIFDN